MFGTLWSWIWGGLGGAGPATVITAEGRLTVARPTHGVLTIARPTRGVLTVTTP